MAGGEAARMLADAPFVRLAMTTPSGAPLFRTVNTVVLEGALYFHGARAGEKMAGLGQPAVASVDEVVASIPSTWVHPELACPATTLYRSVQAHGALVEETDHATKVRVLSALLHKLQPEGGYLPLEAAPERYGPVVRGLLVAKLPLAEIDGKAKLAQNRSPAEVGRILEGLWTRGGAGDTRAIELVRRANRDRCPSLSFAPRLVTGDDEVELVVQGGPEDAPAVATLLADTYWCRGVATDAIVRAHLSSSAWVLARDGHGRIVGSARALSDGARRAWIYDVVIAPELRGLGIGRALMRLLEDHPAVRGAARVELSTRDAMTFYERLGYAPVEERLPARTTMVRVRPD